MINALLFADTIALIMLYNRYLSNQLLTDYQLMIGYQDYIVIKKPIIIDMLVTPHIFVSGLSGQGKSKMVEYMLKDKNVILINAFEDDYISLGSVRRVNGNDKILYFLNYLSSILRNRNRNSKPLYLCIDELLVLCYDKKISQVLFTLLCTARHFNIFVIGISQIGTKDSVKFKDLFNVRISFRQVEESSYRAVLGYSPEYKNLSKQQFHLYSDKILNGFTYDV